MLFILATEGIGSIELRGKHMAEALGADTSQNVGNRTNDVVVFVKVADPNQVKKAREQGNLVVYDVLDFFCYPDRIYPWGSWIDVLIVPNEACIKFYAKIFPNARFVVIPHQWDYRITKLAEHDKPRAAYIGSILNYRLEGVEGVFEESRMVKAASEYNIHVCTGRREKLSALLKPATKIAQAAGAGAVAIAYPDPSSTELLGEDYPFLVKHDVNETLQDAYKAFGTDKWLEARRKMLKLRSQLCREEIAKKYKQLEAVTV